MRRVRRRALSCWSLWWWACCALVHGTAVLATPGIEMFSPQGSMKDVRQVSVRFTTPMVAFGDPRVAEPFAVDCAAPGRGRWADARNWVYDFEAELPAGRVCHFTLKEGLRDLQGEAFTEHPV